MAREQDTIVFRVRGDVSAAGDPSGIGQGIGQTLARRLAELHGGSASVHCCGQGEANELTVRLPAAPDSSEPIAEPVAGPKPAAAAGERILIVDDNVDTARGMARLLQLAGHDVRVAHDGHQALEIARDHGPQFVLLDIVLPGMDGYEVARQLRDDPRLRNTTIIAISGYSADDYRCPQEAGFDHHLVKPVDYNALRAIIERQAPAPQEKSISPL